MYEFQLKLKERVQKDRHKILNSKSLENHKVGPSPQKKNKSFNNLDFKF